MYCSKINSILFFTFKIFMFSDFTWKKNLLQEMAGRGGWHPPVPPFPTALLSDGLEFKGDKSSSIK